MFAIYFKYVYDWSLPAYEHIGALLLCICLNVDRQSGVYVNWINFNFGMDKLLHPL